jgi:hypothetical protein
MERNESLLAAQWSSYRDFHADRTNLLIHVVTVPLFIVGTLMLPLAAVANWWLAPVGLALMMLALAAQGRGHRRERNPPVPFTGPWNFVKRLFLEQTVTFPRYLLSGALARAWRGGPGPDRPANPPRGST